MSYTAPIVEWDTVRFSELDTSYVRKSHRECYTEVILIRAEDDLYVKYKDGSTVKLLYAIRVEGVSTK